jgi:CubicO group peptidase (beta-lactamase class C family)
VSSVTPPQGLTLANWDLGGEPSEWAYLHADGLFPHVQVPTARPAVELEHAELDEIAHFPVEPETTLDDYVTVAPVDGLIVVHGGRIVYERYPRMRADDRHLLMSVTKIVPAVLVGILERRGRLDLGMPVDSIIAELGVAGWAGVLIDDILNMRSGIDCPEVGDPAAYTDPAHPFYRFEASLGWRPSDGAPLRSTYEVVAALSAHRPPGTAYEYTGVNTFVLGWLVEQIFDAPLHQVIAEEIWSKVGFEASAHLCVSDEGTAASHGGLSTTLRDLARLGMLFTPSAGLVTEGTIIDDEHLRRVQASGRPNLHDPPSDLPAHVISAYGRSLPPASRQWNYAMADGDLFKGGFGGQGLYVSPTRDLVIAFVGTPRADGAVNKLRWFSRRIATQIFEIGR